MPAPTPLKAPRTHTQEQPAETPSPFPSAPRGFREGTDERGWFVESVGLLALMAGFGESVSRLCKLLYESNIDARHTTQADVIAWLRGNRHARLVKRETVRLALMSLREDARDGHAITRRANDDPPYLGRVRLMRRI